VLLSQPFRKKLIANGLWKRDIQGSTCMDVPNFSTLAPELLASETIRMRGQAGPIANLRFHLFQVNAQHPKPQKPLMTNRFQWIQSRVLISGFFIGDGKTRSDSLRRLVFKQHGFV